MKKFLLVIFLLLSIAGFAEAQCASTTPNFGFLVPAYNCPNWNTSINSNWFQLDNYLHTSIPLPPSGTASHSASTNVTVSSVGDVTTWDSNGNLLESHVQLSSLAPLSSPTFTGTVTSTGDAIFKSGRPWFDVTAFGADPTGVTDSAATINLAIVAATGGGVVWLPKGTYKTATRILLDRSNVALLCERGTKIQFTPVDPINGFNGYGVLMGQGSSADRPITGSITAGATSFVATSGASTADLVANDRLILYIKDATYNDAVNIDFAQVASVAGTTVNLQQPFPQSMAPTGSQTFQFQRMNAVGPPQDNVEIAGCEFDMNLAGATANVAMIAPYWVHGMWFHDNVVNVTPGTSSGNFMALFRSQEVHINSNKFLVSGNGAGNASYEDSESVDVDVSNNTFQSQSGTATYAISLDFGINRFTFSGNKINNSKDFGILGYAGPHNGIINGNVIGLVAGQGKGVAMLGGRNIIVSNNVMLGPATAATGYGVGFGDDGGAAVPLVSSKNIAINNKLGISQAFLNNFSISNSSDMAIGDDGAGGYTFNHSITLGPSTFANLGTPVNGTQIYCSDCNATCTAGASTGRTCFRENGAWIH